MIVVLTSNYDGAMPQMAFQMRNEFMKIDGASVVFIPSQANVEDDEFVERYERKNSLIPFDRQYAAIAKRIEAYNPKLVYVCDTNLITGRIIQHLPKSIPVIMTVHDVNAHPNYTSLSVAIKDRAKQPYTMQALKKCNRIVLMSNNSYEGFKAKYPQFSNKLSLIRLGAHVPMAKDEYPPELEGLNGFILFFGRLDKYKGIINLLKAYENKKGQIKSKIVIAGKGILTEEENNIINAHPESVILVKRYISDGEMIWLFKNAACTVLPYIEASQSGVLSMSYHFGKPVIVSDIDGLTEFVEDGKTGVVFHNIDELADALVSVPANAEEMRKDVLEYHDANLDWETNIRRCLEDVI